MIDENESRCSGYTHFLDHEGQIIDDMIFAIKSDDCVLGVFENSQDKWVLDTPWLNGNNEERRMKENMATNHVGLVQ